MLPTIQTSHKVDMTMSISFGSTFVEKKKIQ